jgi:hypothetical protein
MKYKLIVLLLCLGQIIAQQSLSETPDVYVLHGRLDSEWGGTPSESETTSHKYWIEKGGIGEFKNEFVSIAFGSRTLSGNAPTNAILIMTLNVYNHIQNIQIFDIIGLDASVGLLVYSDDLWEHLINMSQDELLAYCAFPDPISYDAAVDIAIEYMHNRFPDALAIESAEHNSIENCRQAMSWYIRVEFAKDDAVWKTLVVVNDRGIVVTAYTGW